MSGQARRGGNDQGDTTPRFQAPHAGPASRFLAWVVRPQFNALVVVAGFVVGTLESVSLPWWGNVLVGCALGAAYAVLTDALRWFVRRKTRKP